MNSKYVWVTTTPDQYKSTDVETVGSLRVIGNKVYRWVRNSTGGALTVGGFYCFGYGSTSGYSYGQEIFTLGQSSKQTAISMMAGVAVSAIPDGQFGWIQCYGLNTDALVESTTDVAQGDSLKMVSGQVYAVKATAVASNVERWNALNLVAKTADSSAASPVFLNCL